MLLSPFCSLSGRITVRTEFSGGFICFSPFPFSPCEFTYLPSQVWKTSYVARSFYGIYSFLPLFIRAILHAANSTGYYPLSGMASRPFRAQPTALGGYGGHT